MDRLDFIDNIDRELVEKRESLEKLKEDFRNRYKKEVPEPEKIGLSGTVFMTETDESKDVWKIRGLESRINIMEDDKRKVRELGRVIEILDREGVDKWKLEILAKYAPTEFSFDDEDYD